MESKSDPSLALVPVSPPPVPTPEKSTLPCANCSKDRFSFQWFCYLIALALVGHGLIGKSEVNMAEVTTGVSVLLAAKVSPTSKVDDLLNTSVSDLIGGSK
jgi:hypothetical protein